jgi:hypothetical protein
VEAGWVGDSLPLQPGPGEGGELGRGAGRVG